MANRRATGGANMAATVGGCRLRWGGRCVSFREVMLEIAVACPEQSGCFEVLQGLCFGTDFKPALLIAGDGVACVSFADAQADVHTPGPREAAIAATFEWGKGWMLRQGATDFERGRDSRRMRFLAGSWPPGPQPSRGELGNVLAMVEPLYMQAVVEAGRDPRVLRWEARLRALQAEPQPEGAAMMRWGSVWLVKEAQVRGQRHHSDEVARRRVRRRLADLLLNERLLGM